MSSPTKEPQPAVPADETVDLGEESDDYDAEFDVGLVSCGFIIESRTDMVSFRAKRKREDSMKKTTMAMMTTTKKKGKRRKRKVRNQCVSSNFQSIVVL